MPKKKSNRTKLKPSAKKLKKVKHEIDCNIEMMSEIAHDALEMAIVDYEQGRLESTPFDQLIYWIEHFKDEHFKAVEYFEKKSRKTKAPKGTLLI